MADKQTFSQTFSHSRSQRSCSHRAACGKKGPMWSEPAAHGPALPVAASGAPPLAAACKKTHLSFLEHFYVCPEAVLVNARFYKNDGSKRAFFALPP